MPLTTEDRAELLDKAVRAAGMIGVVAIVTVLIIIAFYKGRETQMEMFKSHIEWQKSKMDSLESRIKSLEADSVYMRNLIFR